MIVPVFPVLAPQGWAGRTIEPDFYRQPLFGCRSGPAGPGIAISLWQTKKGAPQE